MPLINSVVPYLKKKKRKEPRCGHKQKIVIPSGLIDPNGPTIIEIPEQLQRVSTLIASPKPRKKVWSNADVPFDEKTMYETHPRQRQQQFEDQAHSYGEYMQDYSPDRANTFYQHEQPAVGYDPSVSDAGGSKLLKDLNATLNQVEDKEMSKLEESLRDFQDARRQLIVSAASVGQDDLEEETDAEETDAEELIGTNRN